MSRIEYQTEEWGPKQDTHVQIAWQGSTVHITITDDKIEIVSTTPLAIARPGVNAVEITADPGAKTWDQPS